MFNNQTRFICALYLF